MDQFDFDFGLDESPSQEGPFAEIDAQMEEMKRLVFEGSTKEANEAAVKLSAMILDVAGLDPSKMALNQSAQEFRALLEDGKAHRCGVCLRTSKIYTRNINRVQVLCMIGLARLWDGTPEGVLSSEIEGWIRKKYPDAGAHPTGEIGKLAHWGLVYQPAKTDDVRGGKTSGRWVPTPKLLEFLRGKIRVPKWVKLLNNEALEFSEDTVHVHDEFPKFDYDLLMGA